MERPIFIYEAETAGDVDKDVSEFGGFTKDQIHWPQDRELLPDAFGREALESLKRNALGRASYFSYGVGKLPPVHFPNVEHIQKTPFTHDHWSQYGNLEAAYPRITFMLENYEVRQFPSAFDSIVKEVLKSENTLAAWGKEFEKIDQAARNVYDQISTEMIKTKRHNGYNGGGDQGTFETDPVLYEVSQESGALERKLWGDSLSQITRELSEGNFKNLYNFLHLYSRVKDPITPIRFNYLEQAEIFKHLYEKSRNLLEGKELTPEAENILVTQLALESSFFALPGAADIATVHYHGPHELPYIDVDVVKLPRGEFADPIKVIRIFHELIAESEKRGGAVVTPIAISYFHDPYQEQPELFIVDGNNRATAVLLMIFINFVDFDKNKIINYQENLEKFTSLYDLDIEWERDLSEALRWLLTPGNERKQEEGTTERANFNLDSLLSSPKIIKEFANSFMRALLVQEPNFHTVDAKKSDENKPKIFLLQPMHQAIYNARKSCIAIPSKKQSHGRVKGNHLLMSLRSKVES